MNENKISVTSMFDRLDLYSVLHDVLRSLWAIVLGALAVAMIVNMSVRSDYRSTYSTTATFVVTSRTSTTTYSNLSAANTMADSFTNILNSNLMKKRVTKELDLDDFSASTSASVISGTNLLTLRVTADSPYNTYRITRSIMDNISSLTQYVSTDMVLDVLQEPAVPTGADASFTALLPSARAFLLTFLILVAVFMYLSYRKTTIKSEKDLELLLDARSLGMLYYDRKYNSIRDFLKHRNKKYLITELTAPFEFVERYKKIAALVSGHAKRHGAKAIVVTSYGEHEGKSSVSANLALSLSQQGYRVLLLDCDLRRPSQWKNFLLPNEKLSHTLVDLLEGRATMDETLRYDEKRGVYLMLTRENYPNSTDIVSNPMMCRLVEVSKSHFDFVFIDTPPMSLMADAEVLADMADMSILVVKYDTDPAEQLNDTIDALRDCSAEFAGCILNEVRTVPGARRVVGGYGGYGRYGNYGRYGRYGRYGNYGRYGIQSSERPTPSSAAAKTAGEEKVGTRITKSV